MSIKKQTHESLGSMVSGIRSRFGRGTSATGSVPDSTTTSDSTSASTSASIAAPKNEEQYIGEMFKQALGYELGTARPDIDIVMAFMEEFSTKTNINFDLEKLQKDVEAAYVAYPEMDDSGAGLSESLNNKNILKIKFKK